MNRYTFILLVHTLSFPEVALSNLDGDGNRKLASRVEITNRPCIGLLRPETVNIGGKKGQSKMFCETSNGELYGLGLGLGYRSITLEHATTGPTMTPLHWGGQC
ncbi:predicted protein [Chaetoceros tenuissimus]|uniref:Uncharacterized protein n=1 Tax=Chaetoceros tenuissimus TaxID=426638 RepID=A0AAD3D4G8_9STRA|nr:predicted protein [Chaetoceros tenuissimus]